MKVVLKHIIDLVRQVYGEKVLNAWRGIQKRTIFIDYQYAIYILTTDWLSRCPFLFPIHLPYR